MKYIYFVSFRQSNMDGSEHVSNDELDLPEPITDYNQVLRAEVELSGRYGGVIKIISYTPLRTEPS